MEAKTLELSDTPYPGLRPFRADEADIFFGRERQTDDLLRRLAAHRFLAVVGPSGCGKSSLVAAGMMPALATGFMATAGAHWRIAKLRPGERPLANLASALVESRILDDDRAAQPDAPVFLEAALRRGPRGLVEIVRGSALAPDANLLVLVDQFEELFRFSAGVQRDEAEAFVALLLASAAAPRERIYIAITMRSDFLGECAPFHGLPEAINDGLYLTPRLTRDECAACITGPARVFDADVEPALVNRLLNDFGPDPDQLPLLQHALLRMWNRHDAARRTGANTVLTVADYDAIGGLARSLSDHADEAFAELDPDHQCIAKLMFQRLSDSETARRDRRAPAHVREIAELAGAAIDAVRWVADVFRRRDRCFLMPREGIELTPDTILDVSHESLLRQWNRAVGWIEEEAEAVATYRRLRDAAHSWKAGEPLIAAASLDRALVWRDHVTALWAHRYGPDDDFGLVRGFIRASERDRDAKRMLLQRARSVRRTITTTALAALAVVTVTTWIVWPLFYSWEHAAYYAAYASRDDGSPYGIGELTRDQVQHRPLSFRVITAGLFGHVKRMEAVNNRGELTEIDPEYKGIERRRQLAPSRWIYQYDATGTLASEYQFTHRDEFVQGKIFAPLETANEHRAMFIGAEGAPTPVRGQSDESTYYWVEELHTLKTNTGHITTISYLGTSGEPVTGQERAFATVYKYDQQGHMTSMTSLDASGHPMNDIEGNATMEFKTDALGNELEAVALDSHGRPTMVRGGWSIRREVYDRFGNEIEQAYFDETGRPVVTKDGWHKQHFTRNDQGNIVETRYFDQDGKPTYDAELSCYGSEQERDAMDRPIRRTCIDAVGTPQRNLYGYVTLVMTYDEHGWMREETTLDANDRPTAGQDAYASKRYNYDQKGRTIEVAYLGADGELVNNDEGFARYATKYDDASRTEWTRYLGVEGEPVLLKEGHASVKSKRDIWWNLIEQHYYDKHDDPVVINDGSAGWRTTVDTKGQEIETVLQGKSNEVILGKDGYAGWRREYDLLGRETALHYFGLTGEPVVNVTDGVAGWRSHYDSWGNEIRHEYFDLDDRPVNSRRGDAGWRAVYDTRGNARKRQYFDARDDPTLHAWNGEESFQGRGYATLEQVFDPHGELLEVAYFSVHNERVAHPDNWSHAKHTYDGLGHRTRTSYFGVHDEPVKVGGYHAVTRTYDDRGNVTELRYFDVDGATPVVCDSGFARLVKVYDLHRQVTEETLFGIHGEPTTDNEGAYRFVTTWDPGGHKTRVEKWDHEESPSKLDTIEYQYDEFGNVKERKHVNRDNKPVISYDEPCAIRTWLFSKRQELVEEACLDPERMMSPHLSNGAARVVYDYDRPGEKIAETYYDEHVRPFTTKEGYAGIRYKNDALGRVVETTFVDTRANQTPTRLGYARVVASYDARGDLVERSYFLANDSPMTPVAKAKSEFNVLRRKVKDWFLGPGGRPARLSGNGQHVTLFEYDDYGNVRALIYRDERDHPTLGYSGYVPGLDGDWRLCARWAVQYDEDGNPVGECQQSFAGDDRQARLR